MRQRVQVNCRRCSYARTLTRGSRHGGAWPRDARVEVYRPQVIAAPASKPQKGAALVGFGHRQNIPARIATGTSFGTARTRRVSREMFCHARSMLALLVMKGRETVHFRESVGFGRTKLIERRRVMAKEKSTDTQTIDTQSEHMYRVATPTGQVEVTARHARVVGGCLGFDSDAGLIRIFAPGTWLHVTRK